MARSVFEIPTQPAASQFQISLNGTVYTLTITWCGPAGCWILGIADSSSTPIVTGLPLITGSDLLAQLTYLGIGSGGSMVVLSDAEPFEVPNYVTLGSDGHLLFVAP